MKLLENIALALSSLRASKMRALLTMLGIIIGIGSVIAIYTVGNSMTASITGAMDEMGINMVSAQIYPRDSNSNWSYDDNELITQDMVDEFVRKNADQVASVQTYESIGSGQAKKGRKYANVTLVGLGADGTENEGAKLIQGRDINQRDVQGAKKVAVVSDRFVKTMFPKGTNPIGMEAQIHTKQYGILTFTIVGVYEFKLPAIAANFVSDEDLSSNLITSITAAKRITGAADGHYSVTFKTAEGVDSMDLDKKMQDFFEAKYERNLNTTVVTQNFESMADQFTSITGTVSIAISIIAGISLIVGGIGVMNIMLVSVTERTREIGTRKALGARTNAIRLQFIVESIIICLIGGIIGVILGLILGAVGSSLIGFPAQPSIPIIIIAVLFSMTIGVVFGFYPANKASKLDPIEALRYE